MSVGAIILLVAVMAVFVFEAVSLVITAIKRSKERKKKQVLPEDDNIENNNKEESAT